MVICDRDNIFQLQLVGGVIVNDGAFLTRFFIKWDQISVVFVHKKNISFGKKCHHPRKPSISKFIVYLFVPFEVVAFEFTILNVFSCFSLGNFHKIRNKISNKFLKPLHILWTPPLVLKLGLHSVCLMRTLMGLYRNFSVLEQSDLETVQAKNTLQITRNSIGLCGQYFVI